MQNRQIHRTEIRHEDLLRGLPKGRWVVWWYGAVQKNSQAASLPRVVLWFRELLPDGGLGDVYERASVGINKLALTQIGTIWTDGESESQLAFSGPKLIEVDFTPGRWRLTSQVEHLEATTLHLIPDGQYGMKFKAADRSRVLVFQLKDGRELLVPSLEFFSRCYGRSGHVNRVLATYGWNEAKPRLCERVYANVPAGHWGVKLTDDCRNDDALFLAHVEHDPYAALAAKRIYASLQTDYNKKRNGKGLAFPLIEPWFKGPAKLKVEGIPLDDGQRFLALRILGGSQPAGPPILSWRGNPGAAENQAPDGAPQSGWRGRDLSPGPAGPLASLTSADEPDHNSDAIDVKTPAFEVVGTERHVAHQRLKNAQTRPGQLIPGEKSDRYSGGERHGSARGTGFASIHTETVLQTSGAQRDVWNALLRLHAESPHVVRAVGWFSAARGAVVAAAGEPCMAALRPLQPNEQPDVRLEDPDWVFIDKDALALRGVLVACADTPAGRAFLFEVQRRTVGELPADGTQPKEKPNSGLVVLPQPGLAPNEWIPRVLDGIRNACGVMANVLVYCPPGKRGSYRRSRSKGDQFAGQSTVICALGKVGVEVPRAG